MENYLKIGKTYFDAIITFNIYIPIIKIKGVKLYTEGLAIKL